MNDQTKKTRNKDTFDWEQTRIKEIFEFLKKNAQWNKEYQEREYQRCLLGAGSPRNRLIHFLHLNVNTQSSPDMDALSPFWRDLYQADIEEISTLKKFVEFLKNLKRKKNSKSKTKKTSQVSIPTDYWSTLFDELSMRPGWGAKTTALFVKATIQLHQGPKDLHFWTDATPDDAPLEVKPFLPVDEVILNIFKVLGHPCPRIENLNKALRKRYSAQEMLTWDDLWFWGFFTQKGKNKREFGWNSEKFWGQLSSAKADETELSALGAQFVKLLR